MAEIVPSWAAEPFAAHLTAIYSHCAVAFKKHWIFDDGEQSTIILGDSQSFSRPSPQSPNDFLNRVRVATGHRRLARVRLRYSHAVPLRRRQQRDQESIARSPLAIMGRLNSFRPSESSQRSAHLRPTLGELIVGPELPLWRFRSVRLPRIQSRRASALGHPADAHRAANPAARFLQHTDSACQRAAILHSGIVLWCFIRCKPKRSCTSRSAPS